MSWSFSIGPAKVSEFNDAADAALKAAPISAQNPEGVAAAIQATEAVKALVAAGVIAPPSFFVAASLSGHANPGHAPRPGWSNDQVSINVYQAEPLATV